MDYSDQLRQQMQQVGLASFKALCAAAQVSPSSVKRLRNGQLPQMRLGTLLKLSRALNLSLTELVEQFSTLEQEGPNLALAPSQPADPLLEARSLQQFERLSLQMLESWLLQWPTAVQAVQKAAQKGRDLPASRLIPLVSPVEHLIQSWGVVTIGEVGQAVAYDPRAHQLMAGQAQPGDLVRVRYVGYRQGETLLHRAKVSLASPPDA